MLILTNENKTFDLNQIGSDPIDDIYYSTFDFSDKVNHDYFFRPLTMIETFNNVAIEFQIGEYKVMLPQEWSVILADPETGDIELIPIDDINTRSFHALTVNPAVGSMHRFLPFKAVDIFMDVTWTVPRLSFHNFLVTPLHNGENPPCIFLVNEKDQKRISSLELGFFI